MMKLLRDNNSDPEYVEMRKMLFNPYELYTCSGVDSVIRGAMNTSAGKSDAFFTPEVSVRETGTSLCGGQGVIEAIASLPPFPRDR